MATDLGNVNIGDSPLLYSGAGGGDGGGGGRPFGSMIPVYGGGKPMWMVTHVEYDPVNHKLVQHRVKVRAVLYDGDEDVADVPSGAVSGDVFVAKPVTTCGGSGS